MIRSRMKISIRELRRIVRECVLRESSVEDELTELEPGDLVDTMGDEFGDFAGVRVVELVDDVEVETGVPAADGSSAAHEFSGPGFVGLTPEGDELVFALDQVVPGSKAKYYFPGDEIDDYGRDVPNPYRRMASRDALGHIERG